MTESTRNHVTVLLGGFSSERPVSLMSGNACADELERCGYEVTRLDVGHDVAQQLADLKPDVAFNALHGPFGEDGLIQGILEYLEIPYTHSGVLASALAMDKEKTKDVYRSAGLPVADSLLADKAEVQAHHVMTPPYVVKPYNEGSSVGVYLVDANANTPPKLSEEMPQTVMVEAFLPGRELTCTVMGDRALGVTEILTDGWYDYEAKYAAGGSRHVCPAELPDEITAACLDYALRAHQALGCRGVTRTDFRWDEDKGLDGLFLLETNTQPGMTPTSLSPEHAELIGLSFGEFCKWMVEDASCNR